MAQTPYYTGVNAFEGYPRAQTMVNPYQPMTQPQSMSVNFVGSEDEVRNAYVQPGFTGYFMHKDQPLMYIKTVDQFGRLRELKTFELVERQQTQAASASLTLDDVKAAVAEMVNQAMTDAGWKMKPKKAKEEE